MAAGCSSASILTSLELRARRAGRPWPALRDRARGASTPARRRPSSARTGSMRGAASPISRSSMTGRSRRNSASAMGNRIYGCDDCLAVCPWNRFADAAAANRAFLPRAELAAPRLADLLALDDASFREMFAGSPIKRIGVKRMIRNCLIAAGNSGDRALAPSVREASRRSRSGDRRSSAMGAGSARVFERGDAGRLIDVARPTAARIDMGHAQRAVCPTDRDRRRACSAAAELELEARPFADLQRGRAEMADEVLRGQADEPRRLALTALHRRRLCGCGAAAAGSRRRRATRVRARRGVSGA